MNNELFDFSNLEIETEDNNTFNKNDRGSYKAQDVISCDKLRVGANNP